MQDLTKVAPFKNITTETFTHLIGGSQFSFPPGETMVLPYDTARHFAKHLARKILMADGEHKMKLLNLPQFDPRNDRPLYGEEAEQALISQIIGEVSSAPVSVTLSPEQLLRKRIEELNPPTEVVGGETKSDVIAEMEKLGLPVDKRNSMAKLKEQLNEAKKTQ